MPADSWRISKIAGRRYIEKTEKQGKPVEIERARLQLLSELEEVIAAQKIQLAAANDPNISIASANPNQVVFAPRGNTDERTSVISAIKRNQGLLQKISGNLYAYILQLYNNLMYGNIVEDTFTRARLEANEKLAKLCPDAIKKFVSVYDNMDSNNPEDWANAVHSCRRILLDMADALYPPRDQPISVNGKAIKVGTEQYINRLIQFVSSKVESKTYADVVGADLSSIGIRLDAINNAVCKGTHVDVSKDEASRYIIHTYLLISDIISLYNVAEDMVS